MWLKVLKKLKYSISKVGCSFLIVAALGYANVACGLTLKDWTDVLSNTYKSLTTIIIGGAYAGGCVFATMSVLKFKAHKDNPTQIPLSTPMALLFISGALMFLPTVYSLAGGAIFGSAAQRGNYSPSADIPSYG